MPDHKLRLVHSSSPSNRASEQRAEWGFENARQMGLFEDLDRIRVVLVPIADVSAHLFKRELLNQDPKLIIDTRTFPDFFSIFASTDKALQDFNKRGIEYSQVPLSASEGAGTDWSHLAALRSILGEYLERRIGAPVFVLASTRKNSSALAKKLRGYLSQEVGETRLEEIAR